MKMKLQSVFVLAGCVLGASNGGWAHAKAAPVVVGVAAKNADLVALEPQLRALVSSVRPQARIEVHGDILTVIYHSARSRRIIPFESAIPEIPDAPTDFSLSLGVREGFVNQPGENPVRPPANSWALLLGRYRLKRLADVDFARQSEVVAPGHWAYAALGKLVEATDMTPRVSLANVGRLMTRYEFAVAIARLRNGPQVTDKSNVQAGELLGALDREFEGERTFVEGEVDSTQAGGTNRAWQPRYTYLSLTLAYGSGVKPELVEKIRKVVADYAAQKLKTSAGR